MNSSMSRYYAERLNYVIFKQNRELVNIIWAIHVDRIVSEAA